MKIAWEALVGAALIAACIGVVGRYQITALGDTPGIGGKAVYRLDRWTGQIDRCTEAYHNNGAVVAVECPVNDPPFAIH